MTPVLWGKITTKISLYCAILQKSWFRMCVHLRVSVLLFVHMSVRLSVWWCLHVSVFMCPSGDVLMHASWCPSSNTRPACELHGPAARPACHCSLGGPVRGGTATCVVQCNAVISDHLHQMPGQLVAVRLATSPTPLRLPAMAANRMHLQSVRL